MTPWLQVIGVGEGGVEVLQQRQRELIGAAQTVIGPARLLDGVAELMQQGKPATIASPNDAEAIAQRNLAAIARALLDDAPGDDFSADAPREIVEWEPPLDSMIEQILRRRGTPTVVLASGDPMWFGIGATLTRHLPAQDYELHSHPAAFQLAAARLRWPLQDVATISLHGRPVENLHPHVLPLNRVLALTSDSDTARQVGELLVVRGYGRSHLTVLENLGGRLERILSAPADQVDSADVGDFYVLAIECLPDTAAELLPTVPGLPDDAFVNDGQLTKREVRAATLARLAPYPGALLWDVGAGCGSVAIEWMRAAGGARAIAFEREGERLQMIAVNAQALGTPSLQIENDEAPGSLVGMPAPDAVFLGGGIANDELFEACWSALKPGGRIVANAVTIDGEQALFARQARLGGELVRIEVSRLEPVGDQRAFRPRMAVTQWAVRKPPDSYAVAVE